MRHASVLVLALLLLVPTALAHLDRQRPSIQELQGSRRIDMRMAGTAAEVDLLLAFDPLRDLVRYEIDPTRGTFESEYRADPPSASSAFRADWRIVRFLEYRDTNGDALYQPGTDPVVRDWRPERMQWNVTPARAVFIGGREAQDAVWNGTSRDGPWMRIEAGVAGRAMEDEGARVRPQDVILYLDMGGFPPRDTGDLFAMEWHVTTSPAGVASTDLATTANETVPAGVFVDAPERRALLDWGAQGTLDGREQFVNMTFGEPTTPGNETVLLHFPRFDKTLHMVLVMGLEYVQPERNVPTPAVPALLALAAAVAAVRRFTRAR